MGRKTVLLIEGELSLLEFLSELFMAEKYMVGKTRNVKEAISEINIKNWDVIVLDVHTPGGSGLEDLRKIKQNSPNSPVVVISGYASVQLAVQAMKSGAYDYVIKPFENDDLLRIIGEALSNGSQPSTGKEAGPDDVNHSGFTKMGTDSNNIVGKSAGILNVLEVVRKVARRNTTVLLTGESGTGKSLIARELHNLSERREFPFINVNCAVLPETLLESELFGHEKGAFTGAAAAKPGKFELANKGTIFLDDIQTLSFHTQAKLLRVIQDRAFERVGGQKTLVSDVRVIAATNEDLQEAINAGRFRRDLYYRLYVVGISIPPLRERTEDIPFLSRHFIAQFNKKFFLNIKGLSPEALNILTQYPWPGNIRELENTIERAMVLGSGDIITVNELPSHMLIENESGSQPVKTQFSEMSEDNKNLNNVITDVEKTLLEDALRRTGGHREKTAQLLGISRRTLQYKLKKYEMLNGQIPSSV